MLDISINLGGSLFYPDKFTVTSGLSMVYLFHETASLGIVFNPIKIKCAECNTPIAELAAGSVIIRSKHHGKRHVTTLPVSDLINAL